MTFSSPDEGWRRGRTPRGGAGGACKEEVNGPVALIATQEGKKI